MVCDCEDGVLESVEHPSNQDLQVVTCSAQDCTRPALNGAPSPWLEHNIGLGERAVIAADWEPDGWRVFIFPPPDAERFIPEGYDAVEEPPNNDPSLHPRVGSGYYLNAVYNRELFSSTEFSNYVNQVECDLIIESAHLRRRTLDSLSQVLTMDELSSLHEYSRSTEGRLRIFEFPHTLADRARVESQIQPINATMAEKKRAKKRDPEAAVVFTLGRRNVLLRRFNPAHQVQPGDPDLTNEQESEIEFRQAMDVIRSDANRRLNIMRHFRYDIPEGENFAYLDIYRRQIDHAKSLFDDRYDELPEVKQTLLDTYMHSNGEKKMPSLMAIYVCCFSDSEDGDVGFELREVNGRFIGVNTIWDRLLTMSPYHGKFGGVARANLVWYGLQMGLEAKRGDNKELRFDEKKASRRFQRLEFDGNVDSPEGYKQRQRIRREWRKSVKLVIRMFRG